ncbi:dTDP-4-dehydrorhamnose reductase [Alteromonas mediterranea]|uniref:dTDP-4-dehydrorhamnose reductase n=1 Tax=Alteromonas mediterranea TaxID=314275 RepID=UPI000355731C|nr:dTDP-4-dehydrorhamnose reductase [Alteromonas mediterranea]AGP87108.1 dTDP-4-dehydrorhamnose reductase [Alteromonas mediterranea U4]AGP91231.1 dTDP-4-dehydrorhamnose reductase [Alteromonas mediterranea U7]AGP95065.1 dTDP-4-dehydrorhamnose reductase [Alteromonas mediterranea U8]
MNIVIIGKSGQLAFELSRELENSEHQVTFLGRDDIDITSSSDIEEKLSPLEADVLINASAYTAVDKAEEDTDACNAINTFAVKNLANFCKANGAFMVHVSTDYVFNGHKGSPYLTDDPIEPQGAYGKSKAEGEKALLEILPEASCLIRTAWVYSSHGNNFVKTMLRLMADKPQLAVIDDQIGTPTWAKGLAEACVSAAVNNTRGVYHWTDEGVASWYDFALAIQELGIDKGLLDKAIPVLPIPSSQYPTPAKRPHYSVLDKQTAREAFASCKPTHWRKQLASMLDELKA